MLRTFVAVLALAAALSGSSGAGERGSRALSGWFNVTAENGWRGRRYMDGDQVFAEEFATGPSGRIDVWRFYRRDVLTSEERDLDGDGKVDLQTRWDPRNGLLASVLRDTTRRGVNDLEIERVSHNRWEIREDRNLDGVTDRILFVNAPNDLLDGSDADLATHAGVAELVPREMWREMWSDDGYTGSITAYHRYNNRGVLVQYGEWDGRRIVWRRVPPDFVPESAPVQPLVPLPAEVRAREDRRPGGGFVPPSAVPSPDPVADDRAVRDPFDMTAGAMDEDPYAGLAPADGGVPARGSGDAGGYAAPAAPRMAQLPADESSARSVPARMRPPGTAARRPGRF